MKATSTPPLLNQTRWLAYATASFATGLGAASTAHAAIHYSGPVQSVFNGTSEHLQRDFPLDNGAVLSFSQFASGAHLYDIAYFGVKGGAVSNAFRGYSNNFASKLRPKKEVADGAFVTMADRRFPGILVGIYGEGQFANPGYGFVGFKFNTGAGTQYGWARVKVSGKPRNSFVVVDYAYADPGESISTGQKRTAQEAGGAAPGEGALGLLALGGAGLTAWRRRGGR